MKGKNDADELKDNIEFNVCLKTMYLFNFKLLRPIYLVFGYLCNALKIRYAM